jgi:hypothetical protein
MPGNIFEKPLWYKFDVTDFGLKTFEKIEAAPVQWNDLQKLGHEENLHTLFSLHLSELTEETIDFHSSSIINDNNLDLSGIDIFNRLHLFEIKKIADREALNQVSRYIMSLCLIDREYFKSWLTKDNVKFIKKLNILFNGVLENKRSETKKESNNVKDLSRLAAAWKDRLDQKSEKVHNITVHNKFTFWLVCERISENPEIWDKVKELRAQGIDLRFLIINIRFSTTELCYYLKVEREQNEMIKKINEELLTREKNGDAAHYFVKYYNLCSPSDKKIPPGKGIPLNILNEALIRLDVQRKDVEFCNIEKRAFYIKNPD